MYWVLTWVNNKNRTKGKSEFLEGEFGNEMYRKINGWKKTIRFFRKLNVLPQLVKDPNVGIWKKAMVLGGILYLISPIDIIADPVLGIGWIDDGVLLLYIFSRISDQLDQYITKDSKKQFSFQEEKIIEDVDYKIDDKPDE